MSIRVHIERLVLEGLPVDRHAAAHLQAAVEAELAALFGRRNTRDALTPEAVPALSTPAITIRAGADAAQIGRQIARAVHGGMVP